MKKIIYSICMLAMAAFTFTSCEDVPMPYDDPSVAPGGDTSVTEEPKGDGTLENPFNALAATNYASTLASGETSSESVYIKGIVVSIKENFTTQYGNAAFYIADSENSTNKFYIYRALYLGNKKYTEGDLLAEGDEVIVYGKVTNYNGTLETVQNGAYVYSINGKTAPGGSGDDKPGTGEAKGDGTLENPFNSVAANAYASSLASGEKSDIVYIKGKVVSIRENFTAQYGNAAFYISDDGTSTDQFYVFRTLYLNNVKYTEGDVLSVGDDVIICGKLTNYMGNTPETVQNESYLYSWTKNGGSTGGDDTPGGEVTENSITITAASLGLANGTDVGTQTLSDGTVLTFDGGGNSNTPKYYNTGTNIRMYPKNSVKITAKKKIASVIFNVDEYNGAIYNASGDISAAPGTVKTEGKVITINSVNAAETLITNTSTTTGAASQIRIVSLTINYAE